MVDCPDIKKRLVPLSRVVAAAQVDTFADRGVSQQTYFHWAARGLKKLQQETIKRGKRSVLLTVNHNTRTATLPSDFEQELFIGYINSREERIPIPLKMELTNVNSITDIECEDTCPKCNQNRGICNDLTVTQDVTSVLVHGAFYDKTTIKKLYPNGDYFLEVTTPYYNIDSDDVEYITKKEFIVNISLLPCGCPSNDAETVETIRTCNYDCYCNYYTTCGACCDNNTGGYKIFEESGLIQFDFNFHHDKVYLEYLGFVPKVNGQYAVPEVAFETLVEWTKFKSVENKKSVPIIERTWYFQNYSRERRNMEKMLGRISLAQIIQSVNLTPKFDWNKPWNCGNGVPNTVTVVAAASSTCDTPANGSTVNGGNTYNNTVNNTYVVLAASTYTEIKLLVNGELLSPTEGAFTYQNNALIGATGLAQITVNKITEYLDQDYTFNGVTGTITRTNAWQDADTAVIDFIRLGNGSLNATLQLDDNYIWNYTTAPVAYVTINGNNTLAISNISDNKSGVLYVTQDGAGGYTLAFPDGSLFINGWDGVIDPTPNATTAVAFFYDGTNYRWNLG